MALLRPPLPRAYNTDWDGIEVPKPMFGLVGSGESVDRFCMDEK